jgi:integrative and conjugative element protein (TIGR02256 family)
MTGLRYQLPDRFGTLELSEAVIAHLEKHKQRRWLAKEAGGQLFSPLIKPLTLDIVDITGPRPTDKRSVYGYRPDRAAERAEIDERYLHGLHFVGDWHTHKQEIPEPSSTDLQNIRDTVRDSHHDLAGFVLIVVGMAPFPAGLHVSFHMRTGATVLGLAP